MWALDKLTRKKFHECENWFSRVFSDQVYMYIRNCAKSIMRVRATLTARDTHHHAYSTCSCHAVTSDLVNEYENRIIVAIIGTISAAGLMTC